MHNLGNEEAFLLNFLKILNESKVTYIKNIGFRVIVL